MISEMATTGRQGRSYWWVAPTQAQSTMAYDRLKMMLRKADPDRQSQWQSNDSEHFITLGNGARVWFKTGEKPDHLYGEDVYAAVIDEASRVREDSWHAVRSTLTATRGPVRIIGNVRGRRNWAFELARRAESGEPNLAYSKITAADAVAARVFPQEELDDAERSYSGSPEVFRELYYCEPSDDGGNPFGLAAIQRCIADLGHGPPVVWGFDLGKRRNYTVGVALNADKVVCGFQRWRTDWKNTGQRIRAMVGGTPALIDSTGVGDPIVEELQRDCQAVEGYLFTGPSKQKLMEGLAVAIQNQEVHYPDGPIVSELETFEHELTRTGVKYLAPEGMHDDCVDAIALAVEGHRRFGRGVTIEVHELGGNKSWDLGADEDPMRDWGFDEE